VDEQRSIAYWLEFVGQAETDEEIDVQRRNLENLH
jgi:hypothetical protein